MLVNPNQRSENKKSPAPVKGRDLLALPPLFRLPAQSVRKTPENAAFRASRSRATPCLPRPITRGRCNGRHPIRPTLSCMKVAKGFGRTSPGRSSVNASYAGLQLLKARLSGERTASLTVPIVEFGSCYGSHPDLSSKTPQRRSLFIALSAAVVNS